MKWQFEFTQLKGFQLLSLLCRIHWLLDWTGGLYSGAKLLVQGIVSMDSSCKTQATLSSMNWIVQNQHQTREMLVNAQIHNSVNFHQRMLSGVCKKKRWFPSLHSHGCTQAVIPKGMPWVTFRNGSSTHNTRLLWPQQSWANHLWCLWSNCSTAATMVLYILQDTVSPG